MEENKELVQEEQFETEAPKEEFDAIEEVVIEVDNDSDDEDQEDVAEENQEEMAMKSDSEPDGDEDGEDNDDDGDGKDEKYELLEAELSQLKESYSLLESELKELREFKAQKLHEEKEVEINAVFESVSTKLTDDELAPFKEKAFEMEVSALKKELFALIGQKEFEKEQKFNANGNKQMSISILGDVPTDTKIEASYASIIKKYNNK